MEYSSEKLIEVQRELASEWDINQLLEFRNFIYYGKKTEVIILPD